MQHQVATFIFVYFFYNPNFIKYYTQGTVYIKGDILSSISLLLSSLLIACVTLVSIVNKSWL